MGILDLKKRRNKMNHTNAIGKDVRKELFIQEEIRKSDERVAKISKTIEEQQEKRE